MNQPDMTMAALKMILALVFILGLIWGAYRWTRRTLPAGQAGGKGRLIKVLANHYLGVKKAITVVEVPGSVLVLGVSADRVNLLSRIEDPEILATIRKESAQPAPLRSFRDQLQRLTRGAALPQESGCTDAPNGQAS